MGAHEWIFSGIGVFVLGALAKLAWWSWHRPAAHEKPSATIGAAPASEGSVTVLRMSKSASVNDWIGVTVRVRKGDYYEAARSMTGPFRVEVVDIRTASIPDKFGHRSTDELAVELNVTVGGGVVYPGRRAVFVGVNRYLLPRTESEESADSVYALHVRDDYFSALCISVTHINAHEGCADVRIARITATPR
jgi:hypothetical protein